MPRTLGTEGAGTTDGCPVMARGLGIGTTRDGLWATAAVVPRAALIDVPGGVDLAAAAAMGVAGVTAWRVVTELAQVKPDDTVLVLGATGGVGSIIVSAAEGRVPLQSLNGRASPCAATRGCPSRTRPCAPRSGEPWTRWRQAS